MAEFLNLLSPDEAKKYFYSFLCDFENNIELLKTEQSLDRVIAEQVFSNEDIPSFNRSTVDGFAVKSRDTFGASESLPGYFKVIGEIKMGHLAELEVGSGEAALIHTGGMLPTGTRFGCND